MVDLINTNVPECEEINSDGLKCLRKQYKAQNGEFWEHAGGHIFASPEAKKVFFEDHIDAKAFFEGTPIKHHSPEECTGEGYCAWRRHGE